MLTRSRARSIGWAVILSLCLGLTLALTFRVNAVRSQVRLTERKIVALRMEKTLLETEFETRSNQQQLRNLNDVEFGYQAPTAGQYLESERQLAMLGKPRSPDAPDMIRVAKADPAPAGDSILPAMVNPLTGRAIAAEAPRDKVRARELAAGSTPQTLAERLGHVEDAEPARKVEHLSHIEDKPKPLGKEVAAKVPLAKDAKAAKAAPAKLASAHDAQAPAKPTAKTPAAKVALTKPVPKPASKSAPKVAAKSAGKPATLKVALKPTKARLD